MRICVETFPTNISNKLAQNFPAKCCLLENRNLWASFKALN